MIRKMFALFVCLMLVVGMTTAMAETTQWMTVQLNNGAKVVAPAGYIVLVPGMTDEEVAATGLALTAADVDNLLNSQLMQCDVIAPDVSCEYLISIQPYAFSDFASLDDAVLEAAVPALRTTLSASGVVIDEYQIMRWNDEAYIVMEQSMSDGSGIKRAHAYSVKGGYGINLIMMSYTGELTEEQGEIFANVMLNIVLP